MAEEVLNLDGTPIEGLAAKSALDLVIEARKQREMLDRAEAVSVPGAPILLPKAELLNPRKAKAHPANKGKHLRWVNKSLKEKVDHRLQEGYEVVPESEGGDTLGSEYVLMRLPEEKAEAKRKALMEKGRTWLASAASRDMERTAEQVARILVEKYGHSVREANLLIQDSLAR